VQWEVKLKRFFQVRSRQRDAQTDRDRIGPIVRAIKTGVESSQKERDALRARLRETRDLASFAMGTGDDEYLTREIEDKRRIDEYERQMAMGEKRLTELDQQIASLIELQDLASRRFSADIERMLGPA
jgi:hypothetical protein